MKKRYHLLDGRRIIASEKNSKDGTVLSFRDENGNIVYYDDVIANACYADAHEIRDWADCLADVNEKAA